MRPIGLPLVLLQRDTLGLIGGALLVAVLAAWAIADQPEAASAARHPGREHLFNSSAHQADQGLALVSDLRQETVAAGPACPPDAPVRAYAIAAVDVEITLNRFLDYDPAGR